MKFLLLIFKNVRRNLVRSLLTALGTTVLVAVVTLVWSILKFLDDATTEKSKNLKAIVTEKWQVPSKMPFAYVESLSRGAASKLGDVRPLDSMTWQFFVGTLDPEKQTPDNQMFAIALEPEKLATMMDELDSLPPAEMARFRKVVDLLKANRRGIVVGRDMLKKLHKQVGDRFTLHGINYRDINLEGLEIVGVFPDGRYDNSSAINRAFLDGTLDDYKRSHGTPHALDGVVNLVWLRLPDTEAFSRVDEQIARSPEFSNPAVKCETAASGIATFFEAYRDLIWGMRWLLSPAIIFTLALVIANAISISVRERRTELAVLKVLGFSPAQILLLVLGESLLIGVAAGLTSGLITYATINYGFGGFKFPIAFFGAFYIPINAAWWGLAVGAGAALAGSIIPAYSAQSVKVSEVFAKVG